METIIVSACLLGDKCRYDGKDNYNDKVKFLKEHFNVVPICPEVFGGLKTPRTPSEIKNNAVIDKNGRDVTRYFQKGADDVLNIVRYLHIKKAVLVDNSPSCGVYKIHNGKFNDALIDGEGFTTKILKENGVTCYTIDEVEQLIDKTYKEVLEEEALQKAKKEQEKQEKIRKNTEYSKLNNKKTTLKKKKKYVKK